MVKLTYNAKYYKKTSSACSSIGRPVKGFGPEAKRITQLREEMNRAIRNYIIGFGKHTKTLTINCPVCNNESLSCSGSYTNKMGKDVLLGKARLTEENMKAGFVMADWECQCGYTETKTVQFFDLLEDMNNPELRRK